MATQNFGGIASDNADIAILHDGRSSFGFSKAVCCVSDLTKTCGGGWELNCCNDSITDNITAIFCTWWARLLLGAAGGCESYTVWWKKATVIIRYFGIPYLARKTYETIFVLPRGVPRVG